MSRELTILQLYPNELNVYGDNGNLLALQRRLEWRDITVNIVKHSIGDDASHYQPDIILAGGGQDSNQLKIADDLAKISPKLQSWIEAGLPGLMVCGAYQILGQPYINLAGKTIPGLSLIDFTTKPGQERIIGNLVINSLKFGQIIGYENHSGRTFLSQDVVALGTVVKGLGNNGRDRQEGMLYKNFIGTYCHGPILPKNPRVADFLIQTALRRKYPKNCELIPLDDNIELAAQQQSAARPR